MSVVLFLICNAINLSTVKTRGKITQLLRELYTKIHAPVLDAVIVFF